MLFLILACTDPTSTPDDTGSVEPTPTADTATPTPSGTTGATGTTGDTALSVPLPGWGTLTGDCGELDDGEWTTSDPALFRNTLDLTDLTWADEDTPLSAGAVQILEEGTLGGSSGESEALAYDVLSRCELAELVKSETTIAYLDPNGKKTDLIAEIDERQVGVSVTRALTFVSPDERCGTPSAAAFDELVARKVGDLAISEANAHPKNPWERSLLAVFACDETHADEVERVWATLEATTKGDALLLLTVTEGPDSFIYD